MNSSFDICHSSLTREWLEADGLGGFASGTASGIRTRRYHALLLVATSPPTGRLVLVNGFDAWVETPAGRFSLTSQMFAPGVTTDGSQRLEAFDYRPWPHWIFRFEDGTRIEHEIVVTKGEPLTCVSWKVLGRPRKNVKLFVRPFLSGRDYHSMHKTNPAFRFDAEIASDRVCWQPYSGVPGVTALTNGNYTHDPLWYYNFLYAEERARGLDCEEDLATPGVLSWNLGEGKAALIFTTTENARATLPAQIKPVELLNEHRRREDQRRLAFPSPLHRAADDYIVGGLRGKTILAGYPWFTDWGRDTFIALRGLCLATGRLDDAREILGAWSDAVSEGMLPNRFPDHGEQPEFNSVDASLWYVVAVHEFLCACRSRRQEALTTSRIPHRASRIADQSPLASSPTKLDEVKLLTAIEAILDGYSKGTRFGIRAGSDGLLAAGQSGVQLTWMDARVGEWVVTPRIGKPVEIQALWLNALWIGAQNSPRWRELFERGRAAFQAKFWNRDAGCLFDVIDVDHQPNRNDAAFRPNQIFAVGGLPLQLIEGEPARRIVEAVEARLLTPLGLRSLAPGETGYAPHYQGGVPERDGAYHQGTVWPWLIGPFVEAWVRVRGRTWEAKAEARRRFLAPLIRHLDEAGLGHISEIADADPEHTPGGCPFQAWSVGEALRLDCQVLAETDATVQTRRVRKQNSGTQTCGCLTQ